MSSGRKSIRLYYSKVAPKTILRRTIFRPWPNLGFESIARGPRRFGMHRLGVSRRPRLSASELAARWCTARCAAATAGTLVLVTEDQSALFQIVGRHLDRHPIARQRLDPVLLHLAGGVGDDLVPGIELHAIT